MTIDPSAVVIAAVMALGNIGAIKLLVDRTLGKVDSTEKTTQEHSVLLAKAAETLAGVQASVKELYDSRNKHEKELTAVDALHEFKGCKTPSQGGK